jgi:hypothetical protein
VRTIMLGFFLVVLGCGGSSTAGGNGGSGGNGNGGVGGTMSCATSGSSLDCDRACANLTEICKDPSLKFCVGVCVEVQAYCAQVCKTASSSADYEVFGCLASSSDCASFASCFDTCDGRNQLRPVDLGAHD